MAYSRQEPTVWVPGMSGANQAVGILFENAEELAGLYGPQILSDPRFRCSTTSSSYTQFAEWVIPRNDDDIPVMVAVRIKTTAGTATTRFTYTDGVSNEVVTNTTTSSSYTWLTMLYAGGGTLDPSVHPKFGKLEIKTSAGTASIEGIFCYFYPGAPDPGVLASGFVKTAWWDRESTEDPIPSRLMQQVLNNPRALARSRPAGLFGGVQDMTHATTGDTGTTRYLASDAPKGTSTHELVTVERWLQPYSDRARRRYRLAALLSGTNPGLQVQIGSYAWSVTGTGWHHQVVDLSIGQRTPCAARLRVVSSTGTAYLDTLQVLRERSA